MFEAITLVQTRKVTSFPIVLFGRGFWGGMVDWLSDQVLASGYISPLDKELLQITDDPQEAVTLATTPGPHPTPDSTAQMS